MITKTQQSNEDQERSGSNFSNFDQSPHSPQTKPLQLPINSHKSLGLGNSNPFNPRPTRINELLQPETQIGFSGKTIVLVSSNMSSLHFHDQAANVFQRYPNNDINFVGIWGSENCDKSFFFDKILNLCEIEGEKYSQIVFSDPNSELFFYQRPFIKGKTRFFLVGSKGYKDPDNLSKTERSQLDILLSLCQVIILVEDSTGDDIIKIGFNHLNESFSRLYIDRKKKEEQPSQICWPDSLFVLYTTPDSIRKHKQPENYEQQLCKMFKDYSFSILHNQNSCSQKQVKTYTTITNPLEQLYLKNALIIFTEIYHKISRKDYLNVKYNGFTCPHILAEMIYTLNQHDYLYLPRAFNKAKRSIFSSHYNRHALSYLLKMKQFISEQKPYNTDYLLQAFQVASQQTLDEYFEAQNQISLRPSHDSLCIQYEKKLEDYIDQKEQNILAVNNKKSAKQLNKIDGNSNPNEELMKVQRSRIQKNIRNYDHNAETAFVAAQMKSLYVKSVVSPSQFQAISALNFQADADAETKEDELFQQKIKEKKYELEKRKLELQKLSTRQLANTERTIKELQQIDRLKEEQKQLQIKIKEGEEKLTQLRQRQLMPKMQPNFTGRSQDQMLLDQIQTEINTLKIVLQTKLGQKNNLQKVKNISQDPEVQLLQSKLVAKREQIQQVRKSELRNVVQSSVAGAERRAITARQANIRRVHNSKV